MMSDERVLAQLDDLGRLVRSNASIIGPAISLALTNAGRVIAKAAAKANTPPSGEYEVLRIAQTRGPTIRAEASLLASYSTQKDREGRWFNCQLWQTPGGAYIAVSSNCSDREGERDFIAADVFETDMDETERRIGVMEIFQWSTPARNMAKSLGWKIEIHVD